MPVFNPGMRPTKPRPPRQPQPPQPPQTLGGMQIPKYYTPNNPNLPAWMQGNNASQYVSSQEAIGQSPSFGIQTPQGMQIPSYFTSNNPNLPAWMRGNNASQYVSAQEARGRKKIKFFRTP